MLSVKLIGKEKTISQEKISRNSDERQNKHETCYGGKTSKNKTANVCIRSYNPMVFCFKSTFVNTKQGTSGSKNGLFRGFGISAYRTTFDARVELAGAVGG